MNTHVRILLAILVIVLTLVMDIRRALADREISVYVVQDTPFTGPGGPGGLTPVGVDAIGSAQVIPDDDPDAFSPYNVETFALIDAEDQISCTWYIPSDYPRYGYNATDNYNYIDYYGGSSIDWDYGDTWTHVWLYGNFSFAAHWDVPLGAYVSFYGPNRGDWNGGSDNQYGYGTGDVQGIAVGVSSFEYENRDGGTITWLPLPAGACCSKDGYVHLRVKPTPADSPGFPSGTPTWSGGGWVPQPSEFYFAPSSVSASRGDKTVQATCGISNAYAYFTVFSAAPVWRPNYQFPGRAQDTIGLKEAVDLSVSITPNCLSVADLGGGTWNESYPSLDLGTISNVNSTNGTARWRAPALAETATMEILFVNDVSQIRPKVVAHIPVIAPNRVGTTKWPGTVLYHTYNYASAGFKGTAHVFPANVAFTTLEVREGSVAAVATGYFSYLNGEMHPTGPSNGLGTPFNAVDGTPDNAPDKVLNGDYGYWFLGSGQYSAGDFRWDIPWQYLDENGTWQNFATDSHHATILVGGDMTIEKGGSGVFPTHYGDPTTTPF